MTRFFVVLFVLSLLAAGGAYYWKTQHPAGDMSVEAPVAASGGTESGEVVSETAKSLSQDVKQSLRKASRTQDLASMISLVFSVLSGVGTVVSAYFSYLRYRHQKRLAMRA